MEVPLLRKWKIYGLRVFGQFGDCPKRFIKSENRGLSIG
jgi:hypothetical protein